MSAESPTDALRLLAGLIAADLRAGGPALIHRSCVDAGGAVSIAILADRLESWSEGGLPFGQRPEELRRAHTSRPRNPRIANFCFRRGLIDAWGRRTQKIVELCVAAGHPEPEFAVQAGRWW